MKRRRGREAELYVALHAFRHTCTISEKVRTIRRFSVRSGACNEVVHFVYTPQSDTKIFSRNSRLARALAVVSAGVSPTLQHSIITGPSKPAVFNLFNTAGKSTLPVPNWIITSPFGSPQSFAQKPLTC